MVNGWDRFRPLRNLENKSKPCSHWSKRVSLAQWVGVVLSQGLAEIIQNMSSRMQSASNQRIFGID